MNFNQGDIVLMPFPTSNLGASKPRPAIVVSNSKVNSTEDIILAAITSTIRNDSFSFKLESTDLTKSLNLQSEVRCHKLFTAEKSIIIKKISSLNKVRHKDLYEKISAFLIP